MSGAPIDEHGSSTGDGVRGMMRSIQSNFAEVATKAIITKYGSAGSTA
jgi:hypothetical protein